MVAILSEEDKERVTAEAKPIVSDHLTLRASIERLGEMLGKLVAHDTSEEPEMLRLVDDFGRLVLAHFDREEESGVLEQAAEQAPRFADRIDALLREHAKMRSAITDLCDEAPGPSWSDFEVRFGAFCQMLGAHEQAENEVLMDVYLDDLGGHD